MADYSADFDRQQLLRQQAAMGQNEIANLPLRNQLLQLQLASGQLGNDKQRQLMELVQSIVGGNSQSQPGASPQDAASNPLTSAAGIAPSGGYAGTQSAPASPVQPNAITAAAGVSPTSPPGMGGLTFPRVVGLKLLGGPDMSTDYKMGVEGVSHSPGSEVTDVVTGQRRTIPTLEKGQALDAQGNVYTLPGYAKSVSDVTAANKTAELSATNKQTLLPLGYVGTNGVPLGGTIGGYLGAPSTNNPITSLAAPAQGGGTVSNALSRLDPRTLSAIQADMQATGVQNANVVASATDGRVLPNGQPVSNGQRVAGSISAPQPPGAPPDLMAIQSALDAAKQQGPEGIARFQATHLPTVLNIQDPAQRARALAVFASDMQTPAGTPIHQASDSSAPNSAAMPSAGQNAQAAPAGSTLPLQSPAAAAADKLRAEAPVQFQQKRMTDAHTSNQKVLDNLNDTVRNEAELQNRNNQVIPLLKQYSTGGFAPEDRLHLANAIQNTDAIPDSVKAALVKSIGGGDPAVGKTIENVLATAGIKTMLDSLDKEGKPNRAIFQALQTAQEGLKSGNTSLTQVFGLQKQLYDWHFQQQQELSNTLASPDYNPMTTQQKFSASRDASLKSQLPVAAAPATAAAAPAALPTVNTQGWALHRDAKGNQAYVSPDGKQFQQAK